MSLSSLPLDLLPKSTLHRVLFLSFLLILVWSFFLPTAQRANPEEKFWLTILFVLCCLPTVLFIAGHRFSIPLMPMWGLGYFSMFGMPFFGDVGQASVLSMPPELVLAALRLAVIGAICCLAFFYTPLGFWAETLTPSLQAPWDLQRAPKSGVLLCVLGLAARCLVSTSSGSNTLHQLFHYLSQSTNLGMLTLFLLQLRGKLPVRLKIFLWGGVFPVEYLLGLGSGSVYNAVVVLVPFLFCYTAERRKVPIVSAVLLASILIIPFLGFKSEYRSYAWGAGEEADMALQASSPIQQGLFFVNLVIRRLTEGGVESYTVAMETAQERASHTELLAVVMEMTPEQVPFWKGETYTTLLWVLVPRVLYPDKPRKVLGQEFGHRYEILGEEDTATSINLPHQVVEMYINFGTLGVVIGMALLGCLYRAIGAFLSRPGSGEQSLLIGCTICTVLLNLDSDFSLVFGGLLYYLVIFYIVLRFFHGNATSSRKLPAPV